jgi:hypothetical protein
VPVRFVPSPTVPLVEAEPEREQEIPPDVSRPVRGARALFNYNMDRSGADEDLREQMWSRLEREYVKQARMVLEA